MEKSGCKSNEEKSMYEIMQGFGFSFDSEEDKKIANGLRGILFKTTFNKLSMYSNQVSKSKNDRIMFWELVKSDAKIKQNSDLISDLKNYFDPYNGIPKNPEAILTELINRKLINISERKSEEPEHNI